MQLPKIIHQTWKDQAVPQPFKNYAESWKEHHPDWEYILWTDEMNEAFVRQHFPDFIDRYNRYPMHIQRVDAVRYLILLTYGGLFIDIDFECLKNIESLLGDATCFFGQEPEEHCRSHNKSLIVSNAFMGCVPGAEFFKEIIVELSTRQFQGVYQPNDVLDSTGPFMLARLYEQFSNKQGVNLIESDKLFPLINNTNNILSSLYENSLMFHLTGKEYAIHHFAGTWWKTQF